MNQTHFSDLNLAKIVASLRQAALPSGPAEILQACAEMKQRGIIRDYALGGAFGAMRYTEPFASFDADIFYIPSGSGFDAGIGDIFKHLESKGGQITGDGYVLVGSMPAQFLGASPMIAEGISKATEEDVAGVPVKVLPLEYLVADAVRLGGQKYRDRVRLMMQQGNPDESKLKDVLTRYNLLTRFNLMMEGIRRDD